MGDVIRPSVSTEWASSATVNNGSNSTANKVEPSATHKSTGYGYPEQPARNHTNWWMNSVYQWIDYIDAWIEKWGSINKNFAMNDATTTGRVFGYYGGKVSVTVATQLSAAAGTLTLSDGDGNYTIYFDCADSTVKKQYATPPTSADVIIPLYSVPVGTVVTGVIDTANIVDLRTINTVRKATLAEVTAGTNADKYVSPATLQAFVTPLTSTTVYGKSRVATQSLVNAGVNTQDAVTPATLANSIYTSVGYDQTWAGGGSLSGTTGNRPEPMNFSILGFSGTASPITLEIDVGSVDVPICSSPNVAGVGKAMGSVIVPPNTSWILKPGAGVQHINVYTLS